MNIELPGVTITTIDKSQLASQLADIMNIGLSVDSPTGPMEITKCSNLNEFLDLYSLSNEISADDHTTMLHTMKLLQFTPVYVSRAGSTDVLPAITDKSDTSGSTLVFVDKDHTPYYKLWKFSFDLGGISTNSAYLVFKVNHGDVNALITTSNLLINSNNSVTVTEDSGESSIKKYCLYLGEDPNALGVEDSLDMNNILDSELMPNLENLFTYFNKTITEYNNSHADEEEFVSLPQLANVSLGPDSISINAGLNISFNLSDVFPKPDIFDDNIITSNYYVLLFNENDDHDEFTKRSLGRSAYYSVNGVTYYNTAGSGNQSYPGTLVELKMYDGFGAEPNTAQVRSTADANNNTMSILDFVTYMIDYQRGSGLTSPVMDDSIASVTVGLTEGTGYINTNDLIFYPVHSIYATLIGDSSISDYLTISRVGDNQIRFTTSKSMKLLTNTGIKFTINYGTYDSTHDTYSGGTKFLFMNIGNLSDPDMNTGNTYNISDVNTLNKLIYRVAEFFTYKNDWLNNNYGKSTLWNLVSELPKYKYDMYIVLADNSEIQLGSGEISDSTTNKSLLVITVNSGSEYANKLLNDDYKGCALKIYAYTTTKGDGPSLVVPGNNITLLIVFPFSSPLSCRFTRARNLLTIVPEKVTTNPYVGLVISNTDYFYLKTSIDSVTTSLSDDIISMNMVGITGVLIHNYNISNTRVNNNEHLYENQYIKLTKLIDDNKTNYIFYNGTYPYSQQPNDVLVRISSAKLTYSQFISQLVAAIKTKLSCTPLSDGFSLYEHDDLVDFSITGNSEIIGDISSSVTLFNELINNAGLIVVSKYTNKDNILRYKIDIHDDDPEIYTLTLMRKSSIETYDISFVPNKVNSYGVNIYYTYVNDEDNGSRDFYIFRENEDITNLPPDHYESPLFGGEVLVTDANTDDFITAYNRFREKLGVYYDILFDAGNSNVSVLNAIHNVGKDIYALPVLTEPDYMSPSLLKNYRESLGIDHWLGVLLAPRVPDTTLGNFMVYMSPGTQYIERLILNKLGGKEFAPCFYFTNGRTSLKPKYKYSKDSDRSLLINSLISPIVWDRARLLSYFLLDLTLLKLDSSLSDANNVRQINVLSHICDDTAEGYIGRLNDEGTRNEFLSELRTKIDQRMMNNQTYHMNDYRLICDTTNNTKEVIEQRNLVLDVYVQFLPGIRYVKVFLSVYKLSLDLSEL